MIHWHATGDRAVREALASAYPRARDFTLYKAGGEQIEFACTILQLDELAVRKTTTTGYRSVSLATERIRINLPVSAGVTLSTRHGELCAVPGTSGVAFCAEEPVGRNVHAGYSGFYLELSKEQLVRQAYRLVGARPTIGRIASNLDLQEPLGASLLWCLATTFEEAAKLEAAGLGRLISASRSDLILNLAATAILPTLRERLTQGQKSGGSSVAERAREHIESHAGEPLRLSVLAETLGVSLRALELSFRKRFGCTPVACVRDSRLRLARSKLLAASPSTTVIEVALESGFGNPSVFAARYRTAFGELPSQTLRKTLG